MTLVELLLAVSIIALIATVIAAAVTVVLRQAPETTARVDTARWEQNLGTWLPADLASAEWPIDTPEDPDSPDDPTEAIAYAAYEPCVTDVCTWGENIAHLSWSTPTAVDVSYRYGLVDPADPDSTYEFRRVECKNGGCTSITLVRDMPEPSSGGDAPISVTFPADVLETDPNGSEIVNSSGRRVTVGVRSISGVDLLTFSGGGIERVDLEPAAIRPPEFLQARSGCGGPITLIVDESGSLSTADVAQVRAGVRSFVRTFAGTPTDLQIVGFSNTARVLDEDPNSSPHPWNHWFDLSDQNTVDMLLASGSPIDSLSRVEATNWEDGLYRALYTSAGATYESVGNPATPASELIVFFTDGLSTLDRDLIYKGIQHQTGTSETPEASSIPSHFDYDGWTFTPQSWYRAKWLLQQTATPVIGVGVGSAFNGSIDLYNDTDLPSSVITSDWASSSFPAEVALGDLVVGNDLSNYSGSAVGRYVKVEYDASVGDDGWDPDAVAGADILTTTDFAQFGGALKSIALAECGGSLTVQTRQLATGSPVTAAVTYEVTGVDRPASESTTSAVSKTAVFDIASDDGTASDVLLRPRTLDGTGFQAHSWSCRSRNVEISDSSKMSLSEPAVGAVAGIDINVAANEALSCTLFVVPE